MRVACLLVPLFPLAARLRSEPELRSEVLAILEGSGDTARVVAATRLARKAGLRPGLTLAQARSRMPKLVARERDDQCERAAQEALLEAAEGFSPRVEDAGPGIAYLDVQGLDRRLPGDAPERDLGRALAAAAEAAGLPARVGIAGSKLAARVAAESGPVTVVPPGEEAGFLAPLPLARLAPEIAAASRLERWGIRAIGDLARLPEAEVVSRLGPLGQDLHRMARGIDPRPLVPRQPPPSFREGMSLEWPLVALEPFLFILRSALERLGQRLAARGLAAIRLELTLELEPAGFDERAIDLPAPTCDAKTLLTLIRLDLEARPPGAPVVGFAAAARPDRPRQAQLSLFGPSAPSPDQLATTLARLFALLGPGRVGSPRAVDTHRPEVFTLVDYAPPTPPTVRPEPRRGRGLLTVRTLRPPVPLEVITARASLAEAGALAEPPAGRVPAIDDLDLLALRLVALRPVVASDTAEGPRIGGEVRVASGPWRLEEEWWSGSPTDRDYWDVELSDGALYRIFRERATGDWFADGIYD